MLSGTGIDGYIPESETSDGSIPGSMETQIDNRQMPVDKVGLTVEITVSLYLSTRG